MNIFYKQNNLIFTLSVFFLLPVLQYAQSSSHIENYFKKSHHQVSLANDQLFSEGDDMVSFQYASKIFFTKTLKLESGEQVSRIFSTNEKGHLVPFEKNPKEKNIHIANPALTITGSRIYYNLFQIDENGLKVNSEIWYHDRDFHGNWKPKKKFPNTFELGRGELQHPATGILRDSREDILFFVAEHDEGKGGNDIWACFIKNDGSFSRPFNLPINTPSDEISPFFDVSAQTLYFSSNTTQSLGGFDIFRTQYLLNGNWTTPENLGRPINSYYDDSFFCLQNNGLKTFFSSNRPSSNCSEKTSGCNGLDIYDINIKASLQLFLFDDYDKSPLNGCNIELVELETGEIVSTYLNLPENFATIGLEPNKDYKLIISKKDFIPIFEELSSDGMDYFKINYLEMRLRPMRAKTVSKKELIAENNNFSLQTNNVKIDNVKQDTAIVAYAEIEEKKENTVLGSEKIIKEEKIDLEIEDEKNDELIPEENNKKIDTVIKIEDVPDEKKRKLKFENLFIALDSVNFMQIKNLPNITLQHGEDPIDLLYFHKKLNCTIAFDIKTKNFEPNDVVFMNRYLRSINGLYKKGQEPSIGITLFNGNDSQFVIYTFEDSNSNMKNPSFINTFLFPAHYRNLLPDPASIVKICK